MPAVTIPIPPGFVAHWKMRRDGVIEVELMLFLTPHAARWTAIRKRAKEA